MAEYLILECEEGKDKVSIKSTTRRNKIRVASLDVFRGLAVFLMIFVDYGGSLAPSIGHSPWNGVHLADFVMPFFLFIVGVSVALVYKRVSNRRVATCKALVKTVQLFLLGVFLQGGYFHGITSLTFGVDLERIRLFGILQRITIGYIVAALCEIWFPYNSGTEKQVAVFKSYLLHWCVAVGLCIIYSALLYGLYVPDWQFSVPQSTSSPSSSNNSYISYTVNCSTRGDLGPACNSAGMIDRYVLGINHLYKKPVYRNLKECSDPAVGQGSDSVPPWCHAPFDPEGILSSITAAVTCIIGLQYGHILVLLEDHKDRLLHWMLLSVSFFGLGVFLSYVDIPLNKSLYTISYMLLTSSTAGITFCAFYILVDIYGYRCLTSLLEWMGVHSLSIFVLISSNLAVIAIQGFYSVSPKNNLIHWIVTCFVQK
ncbi:hypothetical protein MKW92_024292 [Papaver armeniacum]|nr:hypothetical protein MKW92_024292 [Papaver armeniacum]